MNNDSTAKPTTYKKWFFSALGLAGLFLAGNLSAFTLKVVDGDGNNVNGFRWQVEEDTSTWTIPGLPTNNTISMVIHKSYAPVVTNGSNATFQVAINVPVTNRYVVSVLAYGYQLGGGLVNTTKRT